MDIPSLVEGMCAMQGLPSPSSGRLLRSYTNDVYEARFSDGDRAILKIYGSNWRTREEILYEVALLQHLKAQGAPVAAPLPPKTDTCDAVHSIVTPEGIRYVVFFERAPGEKPTPPFSPDLYRAFGKAIAQVHEHSTGFSCPYKRPALDLTTLVEVPLTRVLPLLSQANDREFLTALADLIHRALAALEPEGLDWGPVHGDATLDNLHVCPDGSLVLYDFDSGGPGWRAIDLQGWANVPLYRERWTAFRSGYATVRQICSADLSAAPWLTAATDIWGIDIDLERRVLRQGPEATAVYLQERLAGLREREQTLLSGAVPYSHDLP